MTRLGQTEWVEAGLEAASEGGIGNVLVARLAKKLGVTKGSFYWHFKDREAFLSAILEAWKTKQTTSIIDDVENIGGTPADILRNVVSRIGDMNVSLEVAMRHWSISNEDVRLVIIAIDQTRTEHLQSIIERAGVPSNQARDRSLLLYYAFIGEVAFGRAVDLKERATRMESIHNLVLRWP